MLFTWSKTYAFLMLLTAFWIRSSICSRRNKRTIIGYYPLCPRGCASCSSINGCVTCRPRYYLYLHTEARRQTGVCVNKCPNGYYGLRQKDFNQCLRCASPHCEACFSRNYCTRCVAPYLAFRGQCIEHCPNGLHYAAYTKDCREKVDCEISSWSTWGLCTRNGQTCGYKYGTQTRTREVVQVPSANGVKCPVKSDLRRCRLKYRSCVDLLHNSSDPTTLLISDRRKYRKRKRNKLRKKWSKGFRRRRKERKFKKLLKRQRKAEKRKALFPDVTTNQISALLKLQ